MTYRWASFVSTVLCAGSLCLPQAPAHHGIAGATPAAQAEFDRGLSLVYGFNFGAAERAFRQAASAAPSAPMPYWGLALALGPNLNARQPSLAGERAASDALAQARQRAQALPSSPEVAEERAYIAALTLRLSCDPHAPFAKLEMAYGDAMRALAERYPNDPDAATLYAESLMEQRSWFAWINDGEHGPAWNQILSVLRALLQRWPGHLGANHLYIHAAESSGQPGLALASAGRLAAMPHFPGDGHLLHMPAHVYLRTGHFIQAEQASQAAARADRDYLRRRPEDTQYAVSYYLHNLSFLVYAAGMDGDFDAAEATAAELAHGAQGYAAGNAMLQGDLSAPLAVLTRFAKWHQIVSLPPPPPSEPLGDQYYWHLAHTCAAAGVGDTAAAEREERAMSETQQLSWATQHPILIGVPFLPQKDLELIPVALAGWCVAVVKGEPLTAVADLRQAVTAQDNLPPADPPHWYPVREVLGAALLESGQPAEAAEVFAQSLARVPGDPRAIFGLARALAGEGHARQAAAEQAKFQTLWKGGALRLRDY